MFLMLDAVSRGAIAGRDNLWVRLSSGLSSVLRIVEVDRTNPLERISILIQMLGRRFLLGRSKLDPCDPLGVRHHFG